MNPFILTSFFNSVNSIPNTHFVKQFFTERGKMLCTREVVVNINDNLPYFIHTALGVSLTLRKAIFVKIFM